MNDDAAYTPVWSGDGPGGNEVLHALLQRKLRRPESEDAVDDSLAGREDPLTSTVFERLTYLPIAVAWSLLGSAVRGHSDTRWPTSPPAGEPEWRFWPSLRPAPSGRNVVKVEPDVLLRWERHVVVFEMKHWGNQSAAQWHEQVLAVRHAGYEALAMVAVGGRDIIGERERAIAFSRATTTPLFTLSWPALRDAVRAQAPSMSAHERRVLRDVEQALTHWGYGPPREVGSLVQARDALLGPDLLAAGALDAWNPRPIGGLGPVGGFASLIADARHHRLGETRDLSSWSPR